MPDRVQIAAQQGLVDLDAHLPRLARVHRNEHIHLAAADVLLHGGFHGILGKEEASRQTYRRVEIAVVHALELDRDLEPFDGPLRAAVASHAFDHIASKKDLLLKRYDIKGNGILILSQPLTQHGDNRAEDEPQKRA